MCFLWFCFGSEFVNFGSIYRGTTLHFVIFYHCLTVYIVLNIYSQVLYLSKEHKVEQLDTKIDLSIWLRKFPL